MGRGNTLRNQPFPQERGAKSYSEEYPSKQKDTLKQERKTSSILNHSDKTIYFDAILPSNKIKGGSLLPPPKRKPLFTKCSS